MNKVLTIIFLSILGCVSAQDIHFSQSTQNPIYLNPAATGIFDGWERVSISHKNQWVTSDVNYFTTALAADINLFKKQGYEGAYIGIGVQAFNDMGGDARYSNRAADISTSVILPLNRINVLSIGLRGGLAQRSVNHDRLNFGNQFNGAMFDQDLPSYEKEVVSNIYPDISTGVFYKFDNRNYSYKREARFLIEAGISYNHLNKPKIGLNGNIEDRLFAKWVTHFLINKNITAGVFDLEASYDRFDQGPHTENLIGVLGKLYLGNGLNSRITGFRIANKVGFGALYRVGDAIIPQATLEYNSWKLGLSYDVSISQFGNYSRGSGFEISLQYLHLDHALFKKRNN